MTDTFDRLKAALADRYAVERELGSGGMATVYLAEDLKPCHAHRLRRHRMSLCGAVAACVFVFMLAACGGDSASVAAPEESVASVTVAPAANTVVIGATVRLTATAKDAAGNALTGRQVTWSSSNTAIALVTTGVVTGVAQGLSTITATAEGKSGTASVTVKALVFASVSAGGFHTCGVTTDGDAYCWGWNGWGQLGNGTANIGPGARPDPVAGGVAFVSLSAGAFHTCAITTDGTAYCWGRNEDGQLGNGAADGFEHTTPEAVLGGLTFSSVSAGSFHNCGLTTDGTAFCWGRNAGGQLGNDDADLRSRATPDPVGGGLIFESVGGGLNHSCGLTTDGTAYCWGGNLDGELGIGSADGTHHTTPEKISGGLVLASVSTDFIHNCGITAPGVTYCWGGNFGGQLGNGTTANASAPVAISANLTFALVSAGRSHTCALTTEGTGYCWGGNGDGKLGNGGLADVSVPVAVSGGLSFSSVSAGGFHTCGLTTDAATYCWGANSDGQVGDGSTNDRTTPVLVFGQQ